MKRSFVLVCLAALWPAAAVALERPAAENVRQVIEYYYQGQGQGVILAEHFLCTEVATEGETKNDCRLRHDLPVVPQGAEVMLWMNFLVPNGDEGRILILFTRQDRVRHTSQVVVKSAVRYRTWKKIPTDRVGEWTVTILHELGDNDLELASFNYQVE